MVNPSCPELAGANEERPLYGHVLEQLQWLISRFCLQPSAFQITRAYELLCKESLAMRLGELRPDFSTLNDDGTPFQFALRLGTGVTPLQFLSEVGSHDLSSKERVALSWERINVLANLFGAERSWAECREFLEELTTRRSGALFADTGSLFWVGVAFLPEQRPRLRIYVNPYWGGDTQSWSRLDAFAAFFGAQHIWNSQQALLDGQMSPLGLSLTLCENRSPAGRIYVRAYGNPISYYEQIAQRFAGADFALRLKESAQVLLGEDCIYPTKSVVCSFGLDERLDADFKCEFCGHCIFSSDAEAISRCAHWLALMQVNARAYSNMLQALTRRGVSKSRAGLHSFVGLASTPQEWYGTLYLNPGAAGYVAGREDGKKPAEAGDRQIVGVHPETAIERRLLD